MTCLDRFGGVMRGVACHLAWLAVLLATVQAKGQQTSLPGTYNFLRDSDGATASEGTVISITFSLAGTASFSAIGPSQNITDSSP
jgi:Flp pilus assembly pilin Flp